MNERERWVVYPLLFLALGASLRDKLIDRTTTKSIVCQELTIFDEGQPGQDHGPRILAKIGRTDATPNKQSIGYLLVNGEVQIVGQVDVKGIINATQYAIQNVSFIPALPNMAFPDMRALQRLQEKSSQPTPPEKRSEKGAPK